MGAEGKSMENNVSHQLRNAPNVCFTFWVPIDSENQSISTRL